jgi:hypothetical protein
MGAWIMDLDKTDKKLQIDLDRERDSSEELLFELRLINRYFATILGEDLRKDEECDGND